MAGGQGWRGQWKGHWEMSADTSARRGEGMNSMKKGALMAAGLLLSAVTIYVTLAK